MKIGLGIDTGGTFTDAVIYDFKDKKIISSFKASTTIGDLNICINNVLDSIDKKHIDEIQVISLSTTLVTNACVEGKGAKGKLILIGCKREEIVQYGGEYGLNNVNDIIFIDGKVDLNGKEITEPNWNNFEKQILDCEKYVDSFAVVQVWGSVNPVYEVKAKDIISELSNKPVVCGHELSSKLNYMRRAVSCLLNVRLIPVFNSFLDSVKNNIEKRGIKAPLLIVRCDGSVMSEEYARMKPVDTLLSGPAASIAGGLVLGKQKNAVVIDMGGTTSDLGIVENESVRLDEQGATVGNNKTATSSIDIHTKGIGGDSEIEILSDKQIKIGPKRVEPICQLASKYPSIINTLNKLHEIANKHIKNVGVFYYLIGNKTNNKIVNYLKDGPKDVLSICENCDISIYNNDLDDLVKEGVLMKCAITPTDIAHCKGTFIKWDNKASVLSLDIFSKQYNIDKNELCEKVDDKMCELLFTMISKKIYSYESKTEIDNDFYKYAYNNKSKLVDFNIVCKYPIIGLGAPSYLYMPTVAKKLNTKCIIPEYAYVANALGAIAGEIKISEFAEITTLYENNLFAGYHLQTSKGVSVFEQYEEALTNAKTQLTQITKTNLLKRGAINGDISIVIQDNSVKSPYVNDDNKEEYLFRFVKLIASGRCEIVKSGII